MRIKTKMIHAFFTLIFTMSVLLTHPSLAEGADFRIIPGVTCYPLCTPYGYFLMDCPVEWTITDCTDAYGVPAVIAIEDEDDMRHHLMITELTFDTQQKIFEQEDSMLYDFVIDGYAVLNGQSTESSQIVENFDLHGIPAVRVNMVGQGYEIIWVMDIAAYDEAFDLKYGDMWFIMYPLDAEDENYSETISKMVDSFTLQYPQGMSETPASSFEWTETEGEIRIDAYTGEAEYVIVPEEIHGMKVTSVADQAFYEQAVRYVHLPDTIYTMGTFVFGGCTHLGSVSLPNSLETLPRGTFESCFRLNKLFLPDELKRIEDQVFWGNSYLFGLYIPAGLEEIGNSAFILCRMLSSIDVDEENKYFQTNEDGTILFSADGKKLIRYSFLNSDDSYVVPDGVEEIYSQCFYYAPLKEIILPEGLKTIGYGAMEWTKVTNLRIPESTTGIGLMYLASDDETNTEVQSSLSASIETIYGVQGSAAEKYAETLGLNFIPND